MTIDDRRSGVEEARMQRAREVEQLVAAARAGDQGAWNDLVDRFLPLVTAVIRRFRLPMSDADDVNQTVWLRLVEHLDDLREPRALPGWLVTTARNESLRIIRLRGRDTPTDPQSVIMERPDEAPDTDADLLSEERAHALREALEELPEGRRRLLLLLMSDPPLSYDEISNRLEIPIGSIGPTRARALEQLRNTRAMRALTTAMAVNE